VRTCGRSSNRRRLGKGSRARRAWTGSSGRGPTRARDQGRGLEGGSAGEDPQGPRARDETGPQEARTIGRDAPAIDSWASHKVSHPDSRDRLDGENPAFFGRASYGRSIVRQTASIIVPAGGTHRSRIGRRRYRSTRFEPTTRVSVESPNAQGRVIATRLGKEAVVPSGEVRRMPALACADRESMAGVVRGAEGRPPRDETIPRRTRPRLRSDRSRAAYGRRTGVVDSVFRQVVSGGGPGRLLPEAPRTSEQNGDSGLPSTM
jgi:hypothetical protein